MHSICSNLIQGELKCLVQSGKKRRIFQKKILIEIEFRTPWVNFFVHRLSSIQVLSFSAQQQLIFCCSCSRDGNWNVTILREGHTSSLLLMAGWRRSCPKNVANVKSKTPNPFDCISRLSPPSPPAPFYLVVGATSILHVKSVEACWCYERCIGAAAKMRKGIQFLTTFLGGGKIREQNVGYETTSVHIKNYLTNNLFCYLAS